MDREENEKSREFERAQEELHRRLELASNLSGSDRSYMERNAWDSYNRRIRGY